MIVISLKIPEISNIESISSILPQAAPEPDADDFDFEEEAQGVVTPQRRAPGTKNFTFF